MKNADEIVDLCSSVQVVFDIWILVLFAVLVLLFIVGRMVFAVNNESTEKKEE